MDNLIKIGYFEYFGFGYFLGWAQADVKDYKCPYE